MAELLDDPYPMPDFDDFEEIDEYLEKEQEELDKIEEPIIRFPVADGYALYRVVKKDPLTIQHIPAGDAWQIPAAHVRGLRLEDVKHQL